MHQKLKALSELAPRLRLKAQLKRKNGRRCTECVAEAEENKEYTICNDCGEELDRAEFSKAQLKRKEGRRCTECVAEAEGGECGICCGCDLHRRLSVPCPGCNGSMSYCSEACRATDWPKHRGKDCEMFALCPTRDSREAVPPESKRASEMTAEERVAVAKVGMLSTVGAMQLRESPQLRSTMARVFKQLEDDPPSAESESMTMYSMIK